MSPETEAQDLVMLDLLLPLLAGVIGGFCSAAPIGPTNLWAADALLCGRARSYRWFVGGVIVADLLFVSLAAGGRAVVIDDGPTDEIITFAGGMLLIALGIGLHLRRSSGAAGPTRPRRERSGPASLGLGVIMILSNPAFLMVWFYLLEILERMLGAASLSVIGGFLLGVALGDLVWFSLFARLLSHGRKWMRPGSQRGLRTAIAGTFVLLGLLALVGPETLRAVTGKGKGPSPGGERGLAHHASSTSSSRE
ncbi:MAG: LysE family transporter [Acidobacteriota bacterium]